MLDYAHVDVLSAPLNTSVTTASLVSLSQRKKMSESESQEAAAIRMTVGVCSRVF
jgi:hypothetical protein